MGTEEPASEHALRAFPSGYRATVDALRPEQRDRVRENLLAELRSREITLLRTDVVFGTATRPG